ncbi:Mitochondrial basic amino acids transporter [Tolypocladium ophioglossoides CBS 100239]|uniref:Mitochondrial basic amino acids transporter n=1 Tax=Tolypocladium ophioglossoides (strain CBS 100239) TaxID=1163406 RepID=A0A0L0NA24_TOLOC|nr:Mitochondrial basic amino acids transporter [Tolypocladium ophioglossoides CBS 100239]
MSADFWAGYLSGAVGIVVGNPLDLIKVRLQAQSDASSRGQVRLQNAVTGTAAPILGYGALNALLFVSYNRSEAALNRALSTHRSLWATWLAGALGGLSTWVVSTPTELVKCRAQMSTTTPAVSSWTIAQQIWRADGLRGLYFGGIVTALRDSIGYGFYFWSYELATRRWPSSRPDGDDGTVSLRHETPRILLCGGLAGIVTWASIFPLDVIKTRVQTQACSRAPEASPLIPGRPLAPRRLGALQVAREAFREGGLRVFFRGLAICSIRAFIVNAVQWAVYEWIMHEMGQGRARRAVLETDSDGVDG